MPYIDEEIAVGVDPSYSPIHYEMGLVELVKLSYAGGIGAVVYSLEERDKAGNWTTVWETPSTNVAAPYAPSKATTIQDGTAGTGESLISLRSPYGWRSKVAGAVVGSVTHKINLDGREQDSA